MKNKIGVIGVALILLFIGQNVSAKYYDNSYLWLHGRLTTGASDYGEYYRIALGSTYNPLLSSYDYFYNNVANVQAENIRPDSTYTTFQLNTALDRIQKINGTRTQIGAVQYGFFGGGSKDGSFYGLARTNVTRINLTDGTALWNTPIELCTTNAEGIGRDNLVMDDTYVYVNCYETTGDRILKLNQSDGGLEVDQNITDDGHDIDLRYGELDIDNDYIYVTYNYDSSRYVGATPIDNIGSIIDTYNLSANITGIGGNTIRIVLSEGYIYVAGLNDDNITLFKFDKSLNLITTAMIGSDITQVNQITEDNNYIYITSTGTDCAEAGLHIFDHNLDLVDEINSCRVSGIGRTAYKGDTGAGQDFAEIFGWGEVDGEFIGESEMYCELKLWDGLTYGVYDASYCDTAGIVEYEWIIDANYSLTCELDSGTYGSINIDLTPYQQTKYMEIDDGIGDVAIFEWYTTDSDIINSNFTIRVADRSNQAPIENAIVEVYVNEVDKDNLLAKKTTNSDGEANFRTSICYACVNVSKPGYWDATNEVDYKIHCFDNDGGIHEEEPVFLDQKGSSCSVEGYMTINGDNASTFARMRCRDIISNIEHDLVEIDVYNSYYEYLGVPDQAVCTLQFMNENYIYQHLQTWTSDSTQTSSESGGCASCDCEFNFTETTPDRHYFDVWHMDKTQRVTSVDLKLYNSTQFIDWLTLDTSGRYYTDYMLNGTYYNITVTGGGYQDGNTSISPALTTTLEHDIYVFTETDTCWINPLTFKSSEYYDSTKPNDVLRVSYYLVGSGGDIKPPKEITGSDTQFLAGSVTARESISCYTTYTITVESDFYTAKETTINADGRPNVPLTIKLSPKSNIDWSFELNRVQGIIGQYFFYFGLLLLAVITIFLLVTGLQMVGIK